MEALSDVTANVSLGNFSDNSVYVHFALSLPLYWYLFEMQGEIGRQTDQLTPPQACALVKCWNQEETALRETRYSNRR